MGLLYFVASYVPGGKVSKRKGEGRKTERSHEKSKDLSPLGALDFRPFPHFAAFQRSRVLRLMIQNLNAELKGDTAGCTSTLLVGLGQQSCCGSLPGLRQLRRPLAAALLELTQLVSKLDLAVLRSSLRCGKATQARAVLTVR